MSYILDALSKAERERSGGSAPLPLRAAAPKPRRRWRRLAAGAALAALLAAAWLSVRHAGDGATTAASRGVAEPEVTATHPSPARSAASVEPPAGLSAQIIRVPPPRSEAAPAKTLPSRPAEPSPGRPRSADRRAVPPDTSAETPPTALRALPMPPPAPAPPPAIPRAERPPAPPPVEAAKPPPSSPAPQPSLGEAAARLTITILVHSADPGDRIVHINDRRYAEGDKVEGLYLVEAIRPEGVLLAFQGERFFLRAGIGSSTR